MSIEVLPNGKILHSDIAANDLCTEGIPQGGRRAQEPPRHQGAIPAVLRAVSGWREAP